MSEQEGTQIPDDINSILTEEQRQQITDDQRDYLKAQLRLVRFLYPNEKPVASLADEVLSRRHVLSFLHLGISMMQMRIVELVQSILDNYEDESSFGSYDMNKERCKYVNTFKDDIGVYILCENKKTGSYESVRMRCAKTSESPDHHGHFQAITLTQPARAIYSGRKWPSLYAISHGDLYVRACKAKEARMENDAQA